MSFRYMNPGLPKLWNLGISWKNSLTYNPINSFAFDSMGTKQLLSVPNTCNEIWMKVGWHTYKLQGGDNNSYDNKFYIGTGSNMQGILIRNQRLYIMVNNTFWTDTAFGIIASTYYNILIHAVQGDNGYVEVFVSGKRIGIVRQTISFGDYNIYAYTYNNQNEAYLSNFIISDTEISPTEELYLLTAKTTETDMVQTSDSNNPQIFTAETAGQYVSQTMDTDALVTKLGTNNIKVTGIGLGSQPIYRTGEGLSSVGIMMDDVEQEAQVLTTNTNSGLCWTRAVDYTLEDLKTLKLGFTVKE